MNYFTIKEDVNFILKNNLIYEVINKPFHTPFGEIKLLKINENSKDVLAVLTGSSTCFVNTTILLFIEKYIIQGVYKDNNNLIGLVQHLKNGYNSYVKI